MTNIDRIRKMTDEELVLFIHNIEVVAFVIAEADIGGEALSVERWLDWLKREMSENG